LPGIGSPGSAEQLGDLYDVGFDRPESHAIRKDGQMSYAFYARHWNGPVELRGLESRNDGVVDDVNHKDFGVVHGPRACIRMEFDKYV
jgi:alpha-galactosidase